MLGLSEKWRTDLNRIHCDHWSLFWPPPCLSSNDNKNKELKNTITKCHLWISQVQISGRSISWKEWPEITQAGLTWYKAYQPSSSIGQTSPTERREHGIQYWESSSAILTRGPVPVSPGQHDGPDVRMLSDSARVLFVPARCLVVPVCSIFRGSHLVSVSYSVSCLCPRLPPWLSVPGDKWQGKHYHLS